MRRVVACHVLPLQGSRVPRARGQAQPRVRADAPAGDRRPGRRDSRGDAIPLPGLGYRGPDKYRDMILSTATEEIGHIELLATAVTMNLQGAKSEMVDEIATNPMV